MNISFQEAGAQGVTREDIMMDGKVVGVMKISPALGYKMYHAAFNVDKNRCETTGFVQGFGETREKAVIAALNDARNNALSLLKKLDEFELSLYAL